MPLYPPAGGGGGISTITSDDSSVAVTDPTGPSTDLSVASYVGAQITARTAFSGWTSIAEGPGYTGAWEDIADDENSICYGQFGTWPDGTLEIQLACVSGTDVPSTVSDGWDPISNRDIPIPANAVVVGSGDPIPVQLIFGATGGLYVTVPTAYASAGPINLYASCRVNLDN